MHCCRNSAVAWTSAGRWTNHVKSEDGSAWSRQNVGGAWHRGVRLASDCPKHRTREPDRNAVCACLRADFHERRHFYASLLIRHGESVKPVQARLGHASAAETLDTYSHLWPDSDDRTREAVDLVLGAPADSLRTREAT